MRVLNTYQQFLVESKNDFDIATEFDKYNRLIFNNTLTRDFPCVFKKDKNRVGWVELEKTHNSINITKLVLSTTYKLTHEQYVNILVHEMIHVEFVQKGVSEHSDHGPKFIKRMNQVNNDFGLSVNKSENAKYFKINAKPTKIQFVIMDGDGIMVYKKPMTDEDRKLFISKMQFHADYNNEDVTLEFGESESVELSRFRISRTSKTTINSVYALDDIVKKSIEDVKLEKVILKAKKRGKK